jgi:hypothetical protein
MNFLWGAETQQNRILMARLTALINGTTSLERLVIIEAIEETGNVLFGTMLPLATAVEQQLGEQLRYCGPFHFNLESGHAVGADHQALANVALNEQERARCISMVDEVFSAFEGWTHELLRYALAHPARNTLSSATWRIGDDANDAVKAG